MASDAFDFSDVFADIEKKIDAFMKDEATKELASRMFAEESGEDVYGKYEPSTYNRRGVEGGIADWRNYEVTETGPMEIEISNNTVGNSFYQPPKSEGYDEGYINDIIESGSGYWWRKSYIYRHPIPRPFMQKACDKFVDDYLMPSIHFTFFGDF